MRAGGFVVVALALALAACGQPAQKSGQGQGKPSGSTAPAVEAPTSDMLRARACGCTSGECAAQVRTEMAAERERFKAVFDDAEACVVKVGAASFEHASLLERMSYFKDKLCACADRACLENVQKEIMHWAMDHMDELEHAEKTASKAVKEEGDRIEREMRACQDRIEGP